MGGESGLVPILLNNNSSDPVTLNSLIYSGVADACTGVETGDSLSTVLSKVFAAICSQSLTVELTPAELACLGAPPPGFPADTGTADTYLVSAVVEWLITTAIIPRYGTQSGCPVTGDIAFQLGDGITDNASNWSIRFTVGGQLEVTSTSNSLFEMRADMQLNRALVFGEHLQNSSITPTGSEIAWDLDATLNNIIISLDEANWMDGQLMWFARVDNGASGNTVTIQTSGLAPLADGSPINVNALESFGIRYAGNQFKVVFSHIPVTAPDSWHDVGTAGEPPFAAGFQNYTGFGDAPARFKLLSSGLVRLSGAMERTSSFTASSFLLFTLPAGYAPTYDFKKYINTDTLITVATSGSVSISVGASSPLVGVTGPFYLYDFEFELD